MKQLKRRQQTYRLLGKQALCLTAFMPYCLAALPKSPRQEGSALLIGIMLSGIMLTLGVMAARLAVREVQFSADLFLAERAYLSAESGVERALWKLKDDPLAHVETTNDPTLGDANTTVSIRNLVDTTTGNFPPAEFSFGLPPLQSQKFRFRHDTDPSANTNQTPVTGPVRLQLNGPTDLFWRFLCQDPSGRTQALQAQISGSNFNDLTALNGLTDDGVSTTFNAWGSVDKNTCYLSVQNLSSDVRIFTFSGTTMAPHAAHIHAVGVHDGREKHIVFDYAQKNLGALFDFSFLHSEGGL